jgi:hypothetical protein
MSHLSQGRTMESLDAFPSEAWIEELEAETGATWAWIPEIPLALWESNQRDKLLWDNPAMGGMFPGIGIGKSYLRMI